ncbi:MAG: DNA-3-methyladenine glycosylase I [Parvularculaceae bacterium]
MTDLTRCKWAADGDALYKSYHDKEWGVPQRDSRILFEKFILDGFQAGLSWRTILNKRENFRKAFKGFEPAKIARFTQKDIARLLGDAGIVRHRGKIEASIKSAKIYLDMQENGEDFSDYLWNFVDGTPIQNKCKKMSDVQAKTPLSEAISKDMKKRGFNFCGPVIVYAFMQAMGMVNDHTTDCHCYDRIKKLG